MALLSSAVSALNGVTDRRQALLFQGAARIGRLVIQLGCVRIRRRRRAVP
jgi:hypothetical protein